MWDYIKKEKEVVVKYSILGSIINSVIRAVIFALLVHLFLFSDFNETIEVAKTIQDIYRNGLTWNFVLMLIPVVFIISLTIDLGSFSIRYSDKNNEKKKTK